MSALKIQENTSVLAIGLDQLDRAPDQPAGNDPLPPVAYLQSALAAIVEASQPCGPERAGQIVQRLLGAYPNRTAADPKTYVASLTFDLARYPADIAQEAADEVRRTSDFLPTSAKLCLAADRLMGRRFDKRIKAERLLAEHKRRQRPKPYSEWTDEEKTKAERALKAALEAAGAEARTVPREHEVQASGQQPEPSPEEREAALERLRKVREEGLGTNRTGEGR